MMTWAGIGRIIFKAAALFVLANLLFAAFQPLEALGRISLYSVLPPRVRLPYGENSAESYNLSLYNLPAMFASHAISRPKAPDEYRVILIGDSATWGWLLRADDTLAAQLNAANLDRDGQRMVFYNLGYPVLSLTKDLLILDEALRYQPDLVVWPVTLQSFAPSEQVPALVANNASRMDRLSDAYDLALNMADARFVRPSFWERTIIGQRRALADWLRLQVYGVAWAVTGIDQRIPPADEILLRASDFEPDLSWKAYTEPADLTADDLAFDALRAGAALVEAAGARLVIVNEPMFISSGRNSDVRYNAFYPRWVYDAYRVLLHEQAEANGWRLIDLWDAVPPGEFTDTPVHLTPAGVRIMSARLAPLLAGE